MVEDPLRVAPERVLCYNQGMDFSGVISWNVKEVMTWAAYTATGALNLEYDLKNVMYFGEQVEQWASS